MIKNMQGEKTTAKRLAKETVINSLEKTYHSAVNNYNGEIDSMTDREKSLFAEALKKELYRVCKLMGDIETADGDYSDMILNFYNVWESVKWKNKKEKKDCQHSNKLSKILVSLDTTARLIVGNSYNNEPMNY